MILTFVPTVAAAQTPGGAMGTVSGPLSAGPGEVGTLIADIASSFLPIVNVAAILAMTISGFFLAVTGSESQSSTAKRVVIASLAAIMLINVAPSIYNAYINADPGSLISEAEGILSWIEVPIGVLAIVMIIFSGVRAILTFGTEEGVTQLRRTVLFVTIGVVLIAAKTVISDSFALTGTPGPIIGKAVTIMNAILGLLTIVAVAMIIYAAFLMIANIGNDEQYGRAKSLLIRVAIGLVIIVMSAALINLVVGAIP